MSHIFTRLLSSLRPAARAGVGLVASGVVVTILMAGPVTSAQSNGQADVALREAMHVEVAEGDLERAIELYRAVVDRYGDVRPVAAQALLRIGMSYERLGRREARAAYEQLLSAYPDQRQFASEAGSRLARLAGDASPDGVAPTLTPDAARAVILTADLSNADVLSVSRDATKLAVSDFGEGQNIAAVDIGSTDRRLLTDHRWEDREATGFYDAPAIWSPDGTRIAATKGAATPGDGSDGFHWEAGVVEPDGTWRPVYEGGGRGREAKGVWITDWLPAGRGFVGVLQRSDNTYALGVFSDETPSFTPVQSLLWDFDHYESRPDLSPDGRFVVFENGETGATDLRVVALDGSGGSDVTAHPADDKDPVWSPDGKSIVFLSRRLGSYALWGIEMDDGQPVGEPFLIQDGMEDTTLLDWVESGLVFSKGNWLRDGYIMTIDPASDVASGDPVQIRYPLTGKTEWATFSPDGRRIALVHDRVEVVVMSADGSDTRVFPLPSSKLYPRNFQWLPDGSAVSFLQTDDREQPTLYRIDANSGEVSSWPAPEHISYPPWFAWTGRGESIYYTGLPDQVGGFITELDLETGDERTVLSRERAGAIEDAGSIWALQNLTTSPDLASLALHVNRLWDGPGSTWILDVATGELRAIAPGRGGLGPISWSADSRRVFWARVSVDLTDGSVHQFTGLGQDRFEFVGGNVTIRRRHWSPDGSRVLLTVQSITPEVWLLRDVIPAAGRGR